MRDFITCIHHFDIQRPIFNMNGFDINMFIHTCVVSRCNGMIPDENVLDQGHYDYHRHNDRDGDGETASLIRR
jgi:hypothetical protein